MWREARAWWELEPHVEVTARIDVGGARRLTERAAPSLGLLGDAAPEAEGWSAHSTPARAEDGGGAIPRAYYGRLQEGDPAAAFYERAEGRWLRVEPTQGDLFLFAGLWEEPNERTKGLPTYTMVTTTPNEAVEEVHDRMPVVLAPEDAEGWMSPDAVLDELRALLVPCPPEWVKIEDAGPNLPQEDETRCPRPLLATSDEREPTRPELVPGT